MRVSAGHLQLKVPRVQDSDPGPLNPESRALTIGTERNRLSANICQTFMHYLSHPSPVTGNDIYRAQFLSGTQRSRHCGSNSGNI